MLKKLILKEFKLFNLLLRNKNKLIKSIQNKKWHKLNKKVSQNIKYV